MNNNIDRQYKELVEHILHFGVTKADRTGTGTKSIFGWQIRHRMSEGFPMLTTKKVAFKTMVTELLWFLRGDTNIKFLVDNGCHIWDGDAYKNYDNLQSTYHAINEARNMANMDGAKSLELTKPLSKEEFINKIKTDDEFAKKWGELGPIYGKQWRKWKFTDKFTNGEQIAYVNGSIDQIANLISNLKTNPDSRRLMVSAWNVGELDQMVLPPCHYGFQVYTRELSYNERGALYIKKYGEFTVHPFSGYDVVMDSMDIPKRAISLMFNMRSVDVGLGLPFNIASYALLLEIIAKEVNMVPEEVVGSLGDCHIYLNHIEGLKEQMERIPYKLPTVTLSDREVNDISEYTLDDIRLEDYQHHPAIKLPLSN